MSFRLGLRGRMAVSYVLVSAAAVLFIEAVLLAVLIPGIRAAGESVAQAQQRVALTTAANLRLKTELTALDFATAVGNNVTALDTEAPGRSDPSTLLTTAYTVDGSGAALEVVATLDRRIVGSNSADFPPGTLLPADVSGEARSGTMGVHGETVGWATRAVELNRRAIGLVYVRTPAVPATGSAGSAAPAEVTSLVLRGLVVLVLLLPMGALFGLLSTGRLIRRLHRLAAGATAMADGDLKARVPTSASDELGRLEQSFNAMAERLDAAVEVERRTAGAEARRAERTRITRELHDSISQDLFSANLVAGGLRKALPVHSALRQQAEGMEQSLGRVMREMRAMLLELRPVALEDAGLPEALTELCRAYETRLGVSITVQVDPVRLEPAVEHAVLRLVQEALANAARHGEPGVIELRVEAVDGLLTVTVHDDGRGFDPVSAGRRHGMGLGLMRERVDELGGTFEVLSAPQQGTTVKVQLPGGTR